LIDELRAIMKELAKNWLSINPREKRRRVLYAEAGSDLTDEVITKFNARKKKK